MEIILSANTNTLESHQAPTIIAKKYAKRMKTDGDTVIVCIA